MLLEDVSAAGQTLAPEPVAPEGRKGGPARQRGRQVWWVTFVLFLGLGSLWALASPLFSVPDEPVHTVRAASASRGHIVPGRPYGNGFSTWEKVPAVFGQAGQVPGCYVFNPDKPAGCAPPFSGSDEIVEVETSAGLRPPAYYMVVGLPSLEFTSATGVYAMRALNAALCAALLASAVATLWSTPAARLAIAGIALAVTPMVLFLFGAVNPNGIEIAAAIAFWAALAVALSRPEHPEMNRLLGRVAVAGTVLALSRPGSPVWVALAVVTLAGWVGYRRTRDFVRDRRTWPVMGVVGLACTSTYAWVSHYGSLDQTPGGGAGGTLAENIRTSLENTTWKYQSMIGIFGWLDSRPATVSIYLWLVASVGLVVVALVVAPWRSRIVLLALVAAVVLVPVALEAPRAATQGFPWQGRYTLPLAAGVPILAGLQIDQARRLSAKITVRASAAILVAFVVGQLYGHIWATRRYTVGIHGPVNWLAGDGWTPPVPLWLLFVGFVVALPLTAAWLQRLATLGPGDAEQLGPAELQIGSVGVVT